MTNTTRFDHWLDYSRNFAGKLTALTIQSGFAVTSLHHRAQTNDPHFNGTCPAPPAQAGSTASSNSNSNGNNAAIDPSLTADPLRWCSIDLKETLFFHWGGQILQKLGYICDDVISTMRNELYSFEQSILQIQQKITQNLPVITDQSMDYISHPGSSRPSGLIVPETFRGGMLVDLYRQYEYELYRDYYLKQDVTRKYIVKIPYTGKDKVCFLVRTAKMHGKQSGGPLVESVASGGIDEITQCKTSCLSISACSILSLTKLFAFPLFLALLRQTDPNWEAIFFLTDNKPFEDTLSAMLSKLNDSRLVFLDVPIKYRPVVSTSSFESSLLSSPQ
jgi:hypothetical protein